MIRLYIYAAAVAAILGALWGFGHHQKQLGKAEVQAKFDAYIAKQTTDTLQASLANQETSRLIQKAVDRSRQNDFNNTKKLAAANTGLRGADAGMRDDIATLNSRPNAGDTAKALARANADTTLARELLGECSSQYSSLAEEAGRLAGQVIGLQGFVSAIEVTHASD